MGGKTILLYDLKERENALELAFQTRYVNIVSYQWVLFRLRSGHIDAYKRDRSRTTLRVWIEFNYWSSARNFRVVREPAMDSTRQILSVSSRNGCLYNFMIYKTAYEL
ncbi:hypothetical protein PsorP6_008841 [Peronosclerospora sorghi]|uniref:Uncharacterized protein n=1 Tax=Peronosclerospora sorghi TaxID=230839 RepID=A0ACC0VZA2_9STRA|nr:hypothetical protein PsorP6_008841 [Peronosclerospora sorghi]